MPRSIFPLVILCSIGLLALVGCGERSSHPDSSGVTLAGRTMGTVYQVKLRQLPEGLTREALQEDVDRVLEEVNDQMSTYRPDSELSRFNRFDGEDWFEVSRETATVVAEAQRISDLSGGAFDATVGPLVNLWNFGPEHHERQVPTNEELQAARERVDYRRLEVREEAPALRKQSPDLYVDLSGIAKGFGVDQVAQLLEAHGIVDYMVEIGGEVRARGSRPGGGNWRIGIEAPAADSKQLQRIIALDQYSLATSGDYRNYFEIDGRRYSHTIDPRTGQPIDHQLASASVIAETCMTADAWATALMVLGAEEGYRLAVDRDLAAFMIVRDGDRFIEQATPAFESLLRTSTQ